MKILLITDIPPCKDLTAGLVLDRLCRFLPRGALVCFAPIDPKINPKLSKDLEEIPIVYAKKRVETAWQPPGLPLIVAMQSLLYGFGSTLSKVRYLLVPIVLLARIAYRLLYVYPARAFAWLIERARRELAVPRLINQAVKFGKEQNIDCLWVVLQGQTVTQMAAEVAKRLDVPLMTQVWDPLYWWLQARNIDKYNSRAALSDFDAALKASRVCMTASWAMAEEYQRLYGIPCFRVDASHSSSIAKQPNLSSFPRDVIDIGMAGQFYSGSEWFQLMRALTLSGWQIQGTPVRLTVLGGAKPPGEGRIRYLGWRSQEEAIAILSELDLLYCPYPFAAHMEEVSRLSFPSKVALYLAAGRPIVFHGPHWSSPAKYLSEHKAAYIVNDLNCAAIYGALCRLYCDTELYRALGENAQKAFQRDFTLESMRSNFERAIAMALRHSSCECTQTSASVGRTKVGASI